MRVSAPDDGLTTYENFPELIESMKRSAAALRDAQVPYMLGGGLAAWARGGPPRRARRRLLRAPEDAEHALGALVEAGSAGAAARGLLLKPWDGDTLIDLIRSPAARPVDDGYSAVSRRWRWRRKAAGRVARRRADDEADVR